MQELITRLTEKAGISDEQAAKVIDTIKDFVKEKFPMMGGAVDSLLGGDAKTDVPAVAETSFMDKISDFIPGESGEKVEEFAKDTMDNVKEKLGGLFGGGKS